MAQVIGNTLPSWVREHPDGVIDARTGFDLILTQDDIDMAIREKAHGDGSACAVAQGFLRAGAKTVYIYRTTAYIDFGVGPIERYAVPAKMLRHVINPFDTGNVKKIKPGRYHLSPVPPSNKLGARRSGSEGPLHPDTGTKALTKIERPSRLRIITVGGNVDGVQ